MKAFLVLLVILIGGFFLFIYSGYYNIAASDPHQTIVKWALETTRDHSVRYHAARAPEPPAREEANFKEGFHHYDEVCIICHAAPGVDQSEISKGMNPEPPDLSKAVKEWSRKELFWIVKHGFKLAGMPAFGVTHTDKEIGDIVGFITRLPDISPQEYQRLREELGRENSGEHRHSENESGEQRESEK